MAGQVSELLKQTLMSLEQRKKCSCVFSTNKKVKFNQSIKIKARFVLVVAGSNMIYMVYLYYYNYLVIGDSIVLLFRGVP